MPAPGLTQAAEWLWVLNVAFLLCVSVLIVAGLANSDDWDRERFTGSRPIVDIRDA